jgi:hypothetical protein
MHPEPLAVCEVDSKVSRSMAAGRTAERRPWSAAVLRNHRTTPFRQNGFSEQRDPKAFDAQEAAHAEADLKLQTRPSLK